MEAREIEVTQELIDAWISVLDHLPDHPDAVVLLSSYLFKAAKSYGLSGYGRDLERIDRLTQSHPAKPLVETLVREEAQASNIEDGLACLLNAALQAVSDDVMSGAKINKIWSSDATDTRMVGQVYWNLFCAPGDNGLPIMPNTPAPASAGTATTTYETMSWNQRKDKGVKLHKGPIVRGNPFRKTGARLAVLIAQWLAGRLQSLEAEVGDTSFGYSEDGKVVSIRWHGSTTSEAESSQPVSSLGRRLDEVDTFRSLAQDGVNRGNHADAADTLGLAVTILRRRSEEEIGDHELRLALVSLEAGLASINAGRLSEAADHFLNAERGILTLSGLSPDNVEQELGLAVALIGQGAVHVQSGRFDLAAEALARSVAVSQSLTDQDSDTEIILALALSSLGGAHLGEEHFATATSSLVRAETILRKMQRRNPVDAPAQITLTMTLLTLGQVLLSSGKEREARAKLDESLRLSKTLGEDERFHTEGRLMQATAIFILCVADLLLAFEQEDDHVLGRNMREIDVRLTEAALMLEELQNGRRSAALVASIQEIKERVLEISVELEDD